MLFLWFGWFRLCLCVFPLVNVHPRPWIGALEGWSFTKNWRAYTCDTQPACHERGRKKKTRLNDGSFAERRGFEPRIPFWSIHAFQACALSHSATSPFPVGFPSRNGRARYPIFQHGNKSICVGVQENRNPISEWPLLGSAHRRAQT